MPYTGCAYCFQIDYKQRLVLVCRFLCLQLPNSRTQANGIGHVNGILGACIRTNGPIFGLG